MTGWNSNMTTNLIPHKKKKNTIYHLPHLCLTWAIMDDVAKSGMQTCWNYDWHQAHLSIGCLHQPPTVKFTQISQTKCIFALHTHTVFHGMTYLLSTWGTILPLWTSQWPWYNHMSKIGPFLLSYSVMGKKKYKIKGPSIFFWPSFFASMIALPCKWHLASNCDTPRIRQVLWSTKHVFLCPFIGKIIIEKKHCFYS